MSTREWETRWKHEATVDQYHELVATVADEALPMTVPLSHDDRIRLAADVVMFILGDGEMRALVTDLFAASLRVGSQNAETQ